MDSPAALVARFLRTNGYNETLDAFLKEAGLPPDAGFSSAGDLTIEQILHEKSVFDLSLNFEKLGDGRKEQGWASPSPECPSIVDTLPTSSNILFSSVEKIVTAPGASAEPCLLAATSDRRLNLVDPTSHPHSLIRSLTHLQDSPVLSLTVIKERYLLCTSMSGKTVLYDITNDEVLVERKDHLKYVVKVTHWMDSNSETCWIATAGWDCKVQVYRASFPSRGSPQLSAPHATLDVPTNPECILFVSHPDLEQPVLLLTRRDSTYMFFYRLSTSEEPLIELLGKQNLAPHSNAWIAFTPSAVSLCPTDPSLVAVATSAVPHMKLIIAHLLLPTATGGTVLSPAESALQPQQAAGDTEPPTQASLARAALAVQDRESAAIRIHCSTLSSQNAYSTPALCWRPDGSGVWVNSDDGLLRGIEATTGKIIAELRGHEPGSKVRCLWAGMVKSGGSYDVHEERVISGAFDHKLIIWK